MAVNLDLDALTAQERYKLLTAVVIPRPIAWVTTVNKDGLVNAAPFSFFNVVGQDPALVILGLERRADGSRKDTECNIDANEEFVVNIPTLDDVEAMVATAAAYPSDESEPKVLGLDLVPSVKVTPPRFAKAAVAIECVRLMALSLSAERCILLGRAVGLASRDGLIDLETMHVNWGGNYPVARLFGDRYGRVEDIKTHTIPQPRKT